MLVREIVEIVIVMVGSVTVVGRVAPFVVVVLLCGMFVVVLELL